MTPQELYKENLPAIIAFSEGKEIEVKYRNNPTDKWESYMGGNPIFYTDAHEWRPAKPKQLRPWKPEEVPVGAITRVKGDTSSKQMILWASSDGDSNVEVCLSSTKGLRGFGMDMSLATLLNVYEHSTDKGVTWLPCGVEE